ncbi:MAG: nucleotidyltransferase family protein [Blautia sp.]|uniref:Nucleotidyltransferase family protein n=1 Tax=Blautia ammoniilytica TaxID=2981782 RepID=A0ABT2TT63_9FIRM|nr:MULTISPECIES: nucleotidyltransferase family protein [Blautia]MCU6764594.1 nucleotidyltransferase family protein [Blautia ammoniilytica]NSJ26356.1 NTP transferase domain-containing protein [Blautia glucerasea]SCH50025.1 Glucose-1-phosphate cytidylyltransferase [uncultured Blautia sp.]
MQAVLLAGGLGTRLKSVVNDRPKPMADVCGKPFMEYLILELKKHGITDIVLAVGYKGEMVEEYFGNGEQLDVHIEYSYEKEQLGTAGAIKNAGQYIKESEFFVLNADTFYQAAYSDAIDLYKSENMDMALVLRKVPDVSRYGSVKLDNHMIIGFNEKVSDHISGVINGGIYLMRKTVLDLIPEGKKCSLENEIIPQMLAEKKKLGAVVNEGYFIDIGVPDDYFKFIKDVEQKNIEF